MTPSIKRHLTSRGLQETDPNVLNRSLAAVLDGIEPLAYGDATDLPPAEQAVLRAGGLELERRPGPDPLALTAVKYAAIVERSLSANETAERLQVAESRVRQLVADRSLYSFLLDGRRRIPEFQLLPGGGLVPNIASVNRALRPTLHPVEVFNWLHGDNSDLSLGEEGAATMSPLAWLSAGCDAKLISLLASRL